MTADLLLAIDQGTSSTRAIAFDRWLRPVASAAVQLATSHPQPGWVEQDPEAILESVVESVGRVLDEVGGQSRILAAGLDNQGETVVAWDAEDRRALGPAIVWQCRRSIEIVDRLRATSLEPAIRARSGLPLDPYFSAGKMAWLLEHDEATRRAARSGSLRLGTVDAWLTARLDDGKARTDPSTASRTQLFNLSNLDWDPDLLRWFGIDRSSLPRLTATAGDLGTLHHPRWGGPIPLRAMACDQQAALAGHAGFAPGSMKATYGTGVFVLANTGTSRAVPSDLEMSVAWTLADGSTTTLLQGGLYSAGTLVDWLRDDLGLVRDGSELSSVSMTVPDTGGVRVLPALAGLGAPWWRPEARGVVTGLTTATRGAHLVRAALDGVANGVADLVEAISSKLVAPPARLRVDGGLTRVEYLMQRQADLLGIPVDVASETESTSLGIAGLAGMGAELVGPDDIANANLVRTTYVPTLDRDLRAAERTDWRRFVSETAHL